MRKRLIFCLGLLACCIGLQAAPPRNGGAPMLNEQYNTAAAARLMDAMYAGGPRRVVGKATHFPKVLVIMANFADYSFVSSKADVDSMFNGQNWTKDGATGSVRQYFYDQSSGLYNPHFDVVGPVTLSQGYAYYGNGQNTSARPGYMVTEACALVDDEVDFSQYDLDNDGSVDMVFVFYAGFGENDPPSTDLVAQPSDLVWPHYSRVDYAGCGSNGQFFDGKKVNDYEVSNELDGYYSTATQSVPAGIGVLVHEFCHGLGLPDLYVTGGSQFAHKTWGCWSVMDYGPYNNEMHTPPSLSAYERYFLGWLDPILLNEAADITLVNMPTSNQACLLTSNGQMPATTRTGTFWMLENRRRKGWDIGIPGRGLMLTQVKTWSSNGLNNDANNMKIDLLEADGDSTVDGTSADPKWYGKQGDLFPYEALDSIMVAPAYPITSVTLNDDGTVSFKVCGGLSSSVSTISASSSEGVEKRLENGRLVIVRGDERYDVLGRSESR